MKRYDEAIAAFDQVKAINPSYPNLQKNREIAVQLRDKSGTPGITTKTTSLPVSSESSGKQPTGTSARPTPLSSFAGAIAIIGAGFLVLQRK
jgi:hypothetical protein